VATRDELAAQIAASPYDDELYLIYGDLLQQRGDARGELIAIDAGISRARTGLGAWRRRREAWLADHPELVPEPCHAIDLDWHLGFVRGVSVRDLARHQGTLAELVAHPSLRFATELTLDEPRELTAAQLEAATGCMPLLLRLAIGDPFQRSWRSDDDPAFDLEVLAVTPRLEQLHTSAPIALRRAPRLRRLAVSSVEPPTIEQIARAQLPRLEELSLNVRFANRRSETPRSSTLPQLCELFAAKLPRLSTLELIDVEDGDAVVRELVASPLLRQLRVLRLWNAGLTADGARHVTRDAFGHLEVLDLSDPLIDDDLAAQLARANDHVRVVGPMIRRLLRRA